MSCIYLYLSFSLRYLPVQKCISYLLYYLNGNGGFNVVRDADGYSYILLPFAALLSCDISSSWYIVVYTCHLFLFFSSAQPPRPQSQLYIYQLFTSFISYLSLSYYRVFRLTFPQPFQVRITPSATVSDVTHPSISHHRSSFIFIYFIF